MTINNVVLSYHQKVVESLVCASVDDGFFFSFFLMLVSFCIVYDSFSNSFNRRSVYVELSPPSRRTK